MVRKVTQNKKLLVELDLWQYVDECLECDRCEKSIGLCPLQKGGNGHIKYMGLNNCDVILESKRNRK